MIPKPRFTVRRLMLLVAVVALGFGGWGAWVRYRAMMALGEDYRRRAMYYSAFANFSGGELSEYEQGLAEKKKDPESNPGWTLERFEKAAAGERRIFQHYQAMAKKYDQAALSPWIPIDPDPPFPQSW